MPDDPQNELTTESVKALIAESVKAAVGDLDAKILERDKKISDLEVALKKADEETTRISANRDQILNEKRVLEGREPKGDSNDYTLTREEARNPEIYKRAKKRAKEAGYELKVVDPTNWAPVNTPKRYETDDTIYVSHLLVREGGPSFYRELKAEAEKAGKRVHIATAPEHWPQEAYEGAES